MAVSSADKNRRLAIAGGPLFGDSLGGLAAAGLALGMAGVTVVATIASGVTNDLGVALALLSADAATAGTVRMRRLIHQVDFARTKAFQFLLGGGILFVVGAPFEDPTTTRWSAGLAVSLVLLGMAGTGMAYAVWFTPLEPLGLVTMSATLLLVPVVGVMPVHGLTGPLPD